MANGSGVSRGDGNRNARLARLRDLVPVTNAIVGVDLADAKQMVVVCDHDSKVVARRTFRCRAWGWAWRWTGRRWSRSASSPPDAPASALAQRAQEADQGLRGLLRLFDPEEVRRLREQRQLRAGDALRQPAGVADR